MCEAGEVCSECVGGGGIIPALIFAFIVTVFLLDLALDFPIRNWISSWIKHWLDKLPYPKY